MGKFMTNVTKILLSLIFTSLVSPAKMSVAQAITITHDSYEFESLDSPSGGAGLENYKVRIKGLDNGPESLSIRGNRNNCELDPKDCGATTEAGRGSSSGTTIVNKTAISPGSTAGGTTEISEPTALLLLILGLFGLSRMRGRRID
jgi:hypothetical protein